MKGRGFASFAIFVGLILLTLLFPGGLQLLPILADSAAHPAAAPLQNITAITAGEAHTCALRGMDGIKCWGSNYFGELGDGTTTDRLTPMDVAGLASGARAVDAGAEHTCALTGTGGVKCWGLNWYGGLGDGTVTNRLTPVDVSGLGSGVSAITAGGDHTCTRTSLGGIKCWGSNFVGELGDGTTTERLTPVDVVGLTSGISAITTAWYHTCALTSADGVKCWGRNLEGELGDGTTTNRLTSVDVVGLTSGISAIAAGGNHTCALTRSGGIKCWGSNSTGELGDGTTTGRLTPVDVVGLTSGISAIAAGGDHTCALTGAGGVKCWGYNGSGQLGDGTTTGRLTPVDVVGLTSGISAIAAGGGHTCAVTGAGGVKCWGNNGSGQLGDGTTTNRLTPVDVVDGTTGPVYTVSGGVIDVNNNPVAGVTISAGGGHTTNTDSNGNYTLGALPAGTYTLTPSKSGYTFNPASRTVSISSNSTGKDFNGYNKPPLVFVHGWSGFPPWGSCEWPNPDTYFESVDQQLHASGYYTAYAQLETSACYTPPLLNNVPRLRNAILQAKNATNQPKVILIAHSMGGLVSRAYIEGPNYAGDVDALFTFGSPHRGLSPDLLTFLVLFGNGVSLGYYCEHNQPAVCDFSALGMILFNNSHSPRTTEVKYHFISGDAPYLSRNLLGQTMDVVIGGILGPDDGITLTDSGLGLGLSGAFDRLKTDENHNIFGPRSYFIRDGGQSIGYTQCLKKVLVDKTSVNCGGFGTQQIIAQDTSNLSEHTPFSNGTVLPGQTVVRTISLEGGPTLFAAQWLTSTLSVTLIDPNDQVINPAYAASNPNIVTYSADTNVATYYFPNAIPGQWQLRLQGSIVPSGGTTHITFAAFDSNLTLTGDTDKDQYAPGASATIAATLSGSPSSATVTATILDANGTVQSINLSSIGGGNYQATYSLPSVLGYAEVRLIATGTTTSGVPFERGRSLIFLISSDNGNKTYLPIILKK